MYSSKDYIGIIFPDFLQPPVSQRNYAEAKAGGHVDSFEHPPKTTQLHGKPVCPVSHGMCCVIPA